MQTLRIHWVEDVHVKILEDCNNKTGTAGSPTTVATQPKSTFSIRSALWVVSVGGLPSTTTNDLGFFHTTSFCRLVSAIAVCVRYHVSLWPHVVSGADSLSQHSLWYLSQVSAPPPPPPPPPPPLSLDDGGRHKESTCSICLLD